MTTTLVRKINRVDTMTALFRQGQLTAVELLDNLAEQGLYDIKIEPFVFGRPVSATLDGVRWTF